MQQGPGSAAPAGWAPGIPGPSLPGWLPSSWGTFTVFAGTALLLNNQVLKIIFFHRIAQNSWGWKEAVGVTQSNPLAPAGPPREACLGTFVHLLKVVVYGLNTNFWILVILILLSLLSVWVFLMKKTNADTFCMYSCRMVKKHPKTLSVWEHSFMPHFYYI